MLFGIEETSGELFYVGAGEDFEGGVTSYELTIRASDGTHTIDTTVTVTVTDAAEQLGVRRRELCVRVGGERRREGQRAIAGEGDGDGPGTGRRGSLPPDGRQRVGVVRHRCDERGVVLRRCELEDYESGVTYARVDGTGEPTGRTRLRPRSTRFCTGVFDGDGRVDSGHDEPRRGTSHNSRLVFTAPGEGTYYIATSGNGTYPSGTGTYELEVRDVRDARCSPSRATGSRCRERRGKRQSARSLGTVEATDPDGGTVRYRLVGGNESQRFDIDPDTGEVFYVGSTGRGLREHVSPRTS